MGATKRERQDQFSNIPATQEKEKEKALDLSTYHPGEGADFLARCCYPPGWAAGSLPANQHRVNGKLSHFGLMCTVCCYESVRGDR